MWVLGRICDVQQTYLKITPFLFDIVSYTLIKIIPDESIGSHFVKRNQIWFGMLTMYDFRVTITVFGVNQAYFEPVGPVGQS